MNCLGRAGVNALGSMRAWPNARALQGLESERRSSSDASCSAIDECLTCMGARFAWA